MLTQTRPADKIIVVDDGSTDDPAAVVAQFPTVQFIQQDNRGLAAARNAGLRSAMTSTTLADLLTLLFLADPGSAVRTSLRT